jgi:sulfate transport system ATP-binding protein
MLLLDEPFGALDSRVRKELRRWLRQLHDELHITSVFVTHDQEEALELAARVVVMNRGAIEQVGTPEQVYHEPATRFVYEFLGDVNIFHERVDPAERTSLYVRPHLLEIHRGPGRPGDIPARVQRVHVAGPTVKVELRGEDGELVHAEISQERQLALELVRDDPVYVRPTQPRVFSDDYSI